MKYAVSTICLCKGFFLQFYFDSFELLKWQKKITSAKKRRRDTMILLFTLAMTQVRKTECTTLLNFISLHPKE